MTYAESSGRVIDDVTLPRNVTHQSNISKTAEMLFSNNR